MPLNPTLLAASLLLATFVPAQQPESRRPAAAPTLRSSRQTAEEPVQTQAAKTVQATIRWNQSSTPGMRIHVQLIKRGLIKGKSMVDYRVKVDGAPHDKHYTLYAWPVTAANPLQIMDGLMVANDGTVVCPADSGGSCAKHFKGAELHLTYAPEIGEILRQALISDDHQSRIFFSMVPSPIMQNDKSCSLQAVRLSPSFELALIRGRGFAPHEALHLRTQSYQEVHNVLAKADGEGNFDLSITPFVKGKTTGVIEVTARGKTCSPKISFHWGL